MWEMDRDTVSGGVGVGLFAALLPLPFQMLIGIALAILVRVNIPVTLIMVSLTNPITMGPIFYATYRLGCWLLDSRAAVPWPAMDAGSVVVWVGTVWKPLVLGSVVAGVVGALGGYVLVRLAWSLVVQFRSNLR